MASEASTGTIRQGLERRLAMIRAFSADAPSLTLSEVARAVGITAATARRILLTLEELGYVRSDSRRFSLTPRVLALGWAYLSSLDLGELAGPFMEELSAKTRESCSIATLDLPDIVYVCPGADQSDHDRRPRGRRPTPGVPDLDGAGPPRGPRRRRPHVVPLDLPSRVPHRPHGHRPRKLRETVSRARADGFALVDQELELGLRSIAAPIRNSRGRTIAALNVSAHTSRSTPASLRADVLPHLQAAADQITMALAHRGHL